MKVFLSVLIIGVSFGIWAQSYPPAAEEEGSTAIAYDDVRFVAWATHVEVFRGYINIEDTSVYFQGSNLATFGEPSFAVGPVISSTSEAVSLGDSGIAIVTFANPITNGEGFDFAVFENGHSYDFLELAHVEVSSDGIHFVRFPSHSETQIATQVNGFGSLNPRYLHNLAGKYEFGYGTPFDLEELKDSANLDVNQITHVKIIDVVGSIGEKGTLDSYGNKINDPFPTPFHSGGFDLSGVGVINEYGNLSISVDKIALDIFPNPSSGVIQIRLNNNSIDELEIRNSLGQIIERKQNMNTLEVIQLELSSGMYFVSVRSGDKHLIQKVFIKD